MRRFLVILLGLAVLFPSLQLSASVVYVRLLNDTYAVVLQVVDGEALIVRPVGTNEQALVRLAGITTQGRRDAQNFMINSVLGRTVELRLSDAPQSTRYSSRWTAVYLVHGDVLYNRALLQRGLAILDPEYEGNFLHDLLVTDASLAQNIGLGRWEDTGFRTQFIPPVHGRRGPFWSERVNINTASATQIENILYTSRFGTGAELVRFRSQAPFRTVYEAVFAGVFTRAEFDELWGGMAISTNINTATVNELMQLIGVSLADAQAIILSRSGTAFTSIDQLVTRDLMSAPVLEANRPFIAINNVEEIEFAIPNTVVDVNYATYSELQWAGLTSWQANDIIAARANGYTIKHIGEIQHIIGIGDIRLHELADNIRVNLVRPVGSVTLTNINTASEEDLRRVGFNQAQINTILNWRINRMMNTARDLPFNMAAFNNSISLFTSINSANAVEFMTLSPEMTPDFARRLAEEAAWQPFGSWWDVQEFFRENDLLNLYNQIRPFLVIR